MDSFVMTDRELAENAAEREQQRRAMLAEADYTEYLEAQAAEFGEEEPSADDLAACERAIADAEAAIFGLDGECGPHCLECRDSGTVRHSTGFGLSDWIEEPCRWCRGAQAPVPTPLVVRPRLVIVNLTAA